MSKIRLLLLTGLAAVAVSAIAVTTASAAWEETTTECLAEPGKLPTFCLELAEKPGKLFEVKGTETITSKLVAGTETLLETTFGETVLHIVCATANNTANLEQPEPLTKAGKVGALVIKFETCTLLNAIGTKCEVLNITTKGAAGVFDNVDPVEGILFTPEVGNEFTAITFKSKAGQTCPATLTAQPAKVTGTVLCFAREAEVDKVVHLIECKHEPTNTEDVLLFAEGPATFEIDEEFELSGANKGQAFDVVLG
jgi:hypothetical protein